MINKWKQLPPNIQRFGIVGIVGGVIALAMIFMPDFKDKEERTRGRQDEIRHVLTDRDTRTVGLETLSASVRAMQSKAASQQRVIEKLERDLEAAQQQAKEPSGIIRGQIDDLRRKLDAMSKELEQTKRNHAQEIKKLEELRHEVVVADSEDTQQILDGEHEQRRYGSVGDFVTDGVLFDDLTDKNPLDIFQREEKIEFDTRERRKEGRAGTAAPKINVVMQQKPSPETIEDEIREEAFFLPAGSIITGVLLNGMDAPTGQGARQDPFPVTLRVQKEAILPNRFRADIRECFIVVAGYGDLSSERAYLRGEVISCVREDGGVLETKLNSYAVGEDGKAGVRGRLVSKQGQVIARSLMAGFLSGLSKAFDVKPVAVIDTSSTGSTSWQSNTRGNDWLRSSAVSGASDALDRVADFYLKMAEGMFPVVEIDAGRQIDLIVSSGTRLEFRSMGIRND